MPEMKNTSIRLDEDSKQRADDLIIPLMLAPRYALGMRPKRSSVLRLAILIGLEYLENELDEIIGEAVNSNEN